MGCDIHGHIEVRYRGDNRWYHSMQIEGVRDYEIFARLANVRNYNELEAINPKGLPSDISWETNEDFFLWKSDAHSCSFVSVQEFENVLNKSKCIINNDISYIAALAYMKVYEKAGYDVRLWFDN